MLNTDETTNDRFVVDDGVQPPTRVVGFKRKADFARVYEIFFHCLNQACEIGADRLLAHLAPCTPGTNARFRSNDGLAVMQQRIQRQLLDVRLPRFGEATRCRQNIHALTE
ncbi:hypothetical protein D3C86_1183020 [compost metagenome]